MKTIPNTKRLLGGGGDTPFVRPNVSHCIEDNHVHYNPKPIPFEDMYLTFEALEDEVQILFVEPRNESWFLYASTDNGKHWTEYESSSSGTVMGTLNTGEKLLVKGYNSNMKGRYSSGRIQSTGLNSVYGNTMSLIYGDDFKGVTEFPQDSNSNLISLFGGNLGLVSAENLILPSTVLTTYCYANLFTGCTNLVNAPLLLPATELASDCYSNMFYNCTSLTTTPELPATTLASSCYYQMFYNCTSLTTVPELPVTTLASGCYEKMFYGCSNITTAPVLPATELVSYCYGGMFQGCSNLNYIKAMFTTTPSTNYTSNWVSGIASSGTFVKNSAATWTTTGVNGIPSGWTVETATE